MVEFVPGFTNVLLEFDLSIGETLEALARESILLLEAHARQKIPLGPVKRIPVVYDGPDLQRVADHNALTVEKVISITRMPFIKSNFSASPRAFRTSVNFITSSARLVWLRPGREWPLVLSALAANTRASTRSHRPEVGTFRAHR